MQKEFGVKHQQDFNKIQNEFLELIFYNLHAELPLLQRNQFEGKYGIMMLCFMMTLLQDW